ncbi:MAG TPA: CvpA family protein [Stellaceae bacterium]|nr:CvpA family protein [Stellaceae bacterium]
MNWLDLAVIAIIALSAIFAFARGVVRETLSIVAWVGAAAATLYGFNWAYAEVQPHVHDTMLAQVITGFGLFVGSLIVLTILTGFVARLVHASGLTPIDRTLGFIFGLARGVFLVCLAYLLLDMMVPKPNERPDWIRQAKSGPYLQEGADMLKGLLPEALKIKGSEAADAVKSLTPATQAEDAMRALLNPAPAKPAKSDSAPPSPNYPARERHQLDRVIGNQR